jgi:hypothetical protein
VDEFRGDVHELGAKTKNKLVKLVGEKCLINMKLGEKSQSCLWETRAQGCLVNKDWLAQNYSPEVKIRPISDLVRNDLTVKSASGESLGIVGWVELQLSVPVVLFLATEFF